MLKKAKEKVLDTVTLSLGDAEHLPFENGKFDCLLCTDSFHHYIHSFRFAQAQNTMKMVCLSLLFRYNSCL